ncbi:MAG: hypothetical protein Q9163_003224 [Psora crenata]
MTSQRADTLFNAVQQHPGLPVSVGNVRPVSPSQDGILIPLRTEAEVHAQCELGKAFVVEVPAKSTAFLLRSINSIVPEREHVQLSHLRRVIRREHLPDNIQSEATDATEDGPQPLRRRLAAEYVPVGSTVSVSDAADGVTCLAKHLNRHVLLCATNLIARDDVVTLLSASGASSDALRNLRLSTVTIPLNPPTSEEQARKWSRDYWPTVYKKHNPFGPHPAMVERAANEIRSQIGAHMRLARQAGRAALDTGIGEEIGAIIVDRTDTSDPSILVVAGDGRWKGFEDDKHHVVGNAMAHAVMRAIGMVARKRRACSKHSSEEKDQAAFAETPFTPVEQEVYARSTITPAGYLCLDLELYVTHEPCVMCSMAILHSRFGKVVFGTSMGRTGGLLAERGDDRENRGFGYGLFWRPSLNWKFLAWQWIDNGSSHPPAVADTLHA